MTIIISLNDSEFVDDDAAGWRTDSSDGKMSQPVDIPAELLTVRR
jgi:hypothetical protein